MVFTCFRDHSWHSSFGIHHLAFEQLAFAGEARAAAVWHVLYSSSAVGWTGQAGMPPGDAACWL